MRQMHGRAGTDLLRHHILLPPPLLHVTTDHEQGRSFDRPCHLDGEAARLAA